MGFSKQYKVLGIMSGTSLDGVDLAFITFHYDKIWQYELGICQTIPYDEQWQKELKELHLRPLSEIQESSQRYAIYLSQLISDFILKHNNISKNQVDKIAVSTKFLPPKYFLVKRNTTFSLQDYIKEQNNYWYERIYKKNKIKYLTVFRDKMVNKKKTRSVFYEKYDEF